MIGRSLWAAVAALLAFACPVAAQGPADSPEAEYVVTAWRTPAEVRATGLSVTVIEEDEIRASGAADVVDLLRAVPGLRIARTSGAGSLTTSFTRGGEGDFTLVLVDGVQVNQPGGAYDWAHLSTENVERVEVVRGPASVVYGGDAPSAVVQIFTRRGRGRPAYEVFAEGGKWNTAREGVSAAGTTGDVGWSFGLERLDTKNHLEAENAYGRTTATGRVDLPVGERTAVAATLHITDRTLETPNDNGGDLLPPFVFDPHATTRGVSTSAGLTVTRRVRDDLDAVVTLSRWGESQNTRDPADTIADGNAFISAFFSEQEQARFTADARLDWRPAFLGAGGWLVTVGGEFEEEEFHAVTSFSTSNLSRTNGAAYLTAAGRLHPRLHLSGGVRMDDNSRFAREISVRGAAAWEIPAWGTTLRAAGGDGFRAPSFTDIASTFNNFRPNPNLRGEGEKTWEVGFDQPLLGGRLDLSATYFHASTKGLIRTITDSNGIMTPFNLQRAEREGVEAAVHWRVAPRWTLEGAWTWVNSKVTAPGPTFLDLFQVGQSLPRIPRNTGRAEVRYTGERLRARAGVSLVGSSVDGDFSGFDLETFQTVRVRRPGYSVWDGGIEYDVLPNLTLTAAGTNLFDRRYQEVYGFSAPGSSWTAGARWRF